MSHERRRYFIRQVQAAAAEVRRASDAGVPATLHERIAAALGWTVAETQQFSLRALRDLVRPISPKLADACSERIVNPLTSSDV